MDAETQAQLEFLTNELFSKSTQNIAMAYVLRALIEAHPDRGGLGQNLRSALSNYESILRDQGFSSGMSPELTASSGAAVRNALLPWIAFCEAPPSGTKPAG